MASLSEEFMFNHSIIAPSKSLSLEQQNSLSKIQARFRGGRDRETHVTRSRLGLPVCPFMRTPKNAVCLFLF